MNPKKENKLILSLLVLLVLVYTTGTMYDKEPDFWGRLILFSISMSFALFLILLPLKFLARWYEFDGVLYWLIVILLFIVVYAFNMSLFI